MLKSKDKGSNLTLDDKRNESAQDAWINQLDAIARGVEIEYDSVMGYSTLMMHKTKQIARQLGIPEKQIQWWIDLRTIAYRERDRVVKLLLNKLM